MDETSLEEKDVPLFERDMQMHATLKARRLVVVELGRAYPTTDRNRLQVLSRRLLALLDEPKLDVVAIDMSKTEEFGAGLLSVLARAQRHAERQGHEIAFCGLSTQAEEIFAMAKLDRVWTIYSTRAHAMDTVGVDRISRILAA